MVGFRVDLGLAVVVLTMVKISLCVWVYRTIKKQHGVAFSSVNTAGVHWNLSCLTRGGDPFVETVRALARDGAASSKEQGSVWMGWIRFAAFFDTPTLSRDFLEDKNSNFESTLKSMSSFFFYCIIYYCLPPNGFLVLTLLLIFFRKEWVKKKNTKRH